jgi:hypothetical protein
MGETKKVLEHHTNSDIPTYISGSEKRPLPNRNFLLNDAVFPKI